MTAFRANAEKYVSALRAFKSRGGAAVAFTARPRVPRPGDLVRFTLQAGPPAKEGPAPDPKRLMRLRDGLAYLYRMDRSKPPAPEIRLLQDTEEPGAYGFSKLITEEGEYRIFFVATFDDGREIRAGFDCVTLGALPRDHHLGTEKAAPLPASPHPAAPSTSGDLTMAEQHHTMREIGRRWIELGTLLDRAGRARAAEHLQWIDRWSDNLPRYKLHKFPDRMEEFVSLQREFKGKLAAFQGRFATADEAALRRDYRALDATSCTKCHLKFRWGIVTDLSRFPDVSGQP